MHREFLRAGNPRKIANDYAAFLDPAAITAINAQINLHTAAMYELALSHYTFASKLKRTQWRQKVSRLYYAGYNGSKALRFCREGHHSTEVGDHKKVGSLPDDFPDQNRFGNELSTLREDRNSCDYDHSAELAHLVNQPNHYQALVLEFLRHTNAYLVARGVPLGAAP